MGSFFSALLGHGDCQGDGKSSEYIPDLRQAEVLELESCDPATPWWGGLYPAEETLLPPVAQRNLFVLKTRLVGEDNNQKQIVAQFVRSGYSWLRGSKFCFLIEGREAEEALAGRLRDEVDPERSYYDFMNQAKEGLDRIVEFARDGVIHGEVVLWTAPSSDEADKRIAVGGEEEFTEE